MKTKPENAFRRKFNILKLLREYVKKWWLILLCIELTAVIAWIYTANITPLYRTSITISVNNVGNGEQTESISDNYLNASNQLVKTYMSIINSNTILDKVCEKLGSEYTVAYIQSVLSSRQISETELFEVIITCENPVKAADIGNAIADVFTSEIVNIVDGSSAKLIDNAKVPPSSFYPNNIMNIVRGGAAGGALAIIIITIYYLTDTRIRDKDDLEQLTDLRVFLCIPKPSKCIAKAKNYMRELYKKLRTNVNFALADESGCKIIMVTSTLQNEGKGTTAINLASSYALADSRVLLLDCDLHNPILERLLDLESLYGLCDLLVNPELLSESILHSDVPGLDVMLSGNVFEDSSELLGSSKMQQLLDKLKQEYDYIIIDSAPVSLATDAAVLTPFINGLLFVVRAGVVKMASVAQALEQLEYTRVKMLGFVLKGLG